MQVKQLVQSTANIIRITQLSKGNIVKFVKDDNYDTSVSYAVVMDILNNGEKTYVELMKYKKNYGSVDLESVLISGDKETILFPATPEDLEQHLKSIEQKLREEISDKRDEANKKENALNLLMEMVKNQTITATKFEELPAQLN